MMNHCIIISLFVIVAMANLGGAINCYGRGSSTSSTSQGNLLTCSSWVTSCYQYDFFGISYAGCGDCSGYIDCRWCSSNYCNSRSSNSLISCYTRDAFTSPRSDGTSVACSSSYSSCYQYDSNGINYAGCGSCSSYSFFYSNCRSCSDRSNCNFRNSASGGLHGWKIPVTAAAAAAVTMVALMKPF